MPPDLCSELPSFSAYNTVCIYDLYHVCFLQQYFVNSKVRKLICQPTVGVNLEGRTRRKKAVALEKLKLAPVLDTGNPKIAIRLRYEENLHWQFVPSSGKTERATTAPVLGDGETRTIPPTFLYKNASNVILFAFLPPPPLLFLTSHHSLSNLCLKHRKLYSSFSEQYYIEDSKIQDDSKYSSNLI